MQMRMCTKKEANYQALKKGENTKRCVNPIWTGLFANLKRRGRGAFGHPSYIGYFKSDENETW